MNTWGDGNAMRLFDFTLVGAVLVPSTRIIAEGKAAGTLIETATGEPVITASADAKRLAYSPTNLADGKTDTLRAALRDELTTALADELLRTLAGRQNLAAAGRPGITTSQAK
jgi:hypothetical protein